MFGMQMGRMGQTGAASWLQTFNSLYANGEQGIAKLDFSDFTGMYQDRARTVPYTAVEQPLGSFTGLNGVTATAPADVNRGKVSARVNLYSSTENLSSGWDLTGVTVTASGTSPTGSAAWLMSDSAVTSSHTAGRYMAVTNTRYSMRLLAKPQGGRYAYLQVGNGVDRGAAVFDLQTATVTASSSSGLGAVSFSISPLTDGWLLLSTSAICDAGLRICAFGIYSGPLIGDGIFLGDNTRTILFAEPSFTLSTDAHLPYQWVNTPTDYDTVGFSHYLAFNGTNTAYVTPSIDFTGTDKMTVWAGVTKLSDAATSILLESSADTNSNSGSFYITAPETLGASSLSFKSRGSINTTPVHLFGNAAPVSRVVVGLGDIGGDITTIRVAGASSTSAQNQGTGNCGNYPLYIGARAGTSFYFNGRLYSLIVRGAQSSLSQIEATENLIRQKMRLP